MIFIGMFDGIKENIYCFDWLESFSNGTSWLNCSCDVQGISYTKILLPTTLVLLLGSYSSWFNSLLCNSHSCTFFIPTWAGKKQWGLNLQPQRGQSQDAWSCHSLLLLSGPGGGALQVNKQ